MSNTNSIDPQPINQDHADFLNRELETYIAEVKSRFPGIEALQFKHLRLEAVVNNTDVGPEILLQATVDGETLTHKAKLPR